ncbi:MAG: beta propeller repeat protein [Candidatus Dormibacteria bacterium]
MASDRRSRTITRCAAAGVVLIVFLVGSAPARAAAAWWSPVALRGVAVARVSAIGDTITVRTVSGEMLRSTDAGRTFATAPSDAALPPSGVVTVGTQRWEIDPGGKVVHVANVTQSTSGVVDPGSPDLGPGAGLIASPAALPGVVVAVSTNGTVWRRGQDGDWKQALLLLPASLVQGVPRITAVTAFTEPLSDAIYLGTDGYAVLISTDGGDDWIRAGAGLPDSVSSLSADSARHALYAGTADGLWEHVLQSLPAPPAYQDAALVWRWLGIGAITLVASAAALFGLTRLVPRRLSG